MANPKAQSAADAARSNRAQVEQVITDLVAEVSTLKEERTLLVADRDGGSLTVDTDRIADLEETIIPRKEERLEELQTRILPAAKAEVAAQEIAELATSSRTGLAALRSAEREAYTEAVGHVAAGLEKLRAASTAYDAGVAEIQGRALAAGLRAGKADPLARVLIPDTVTVRVDGIEYTRRDVRGTLSQVCTEAIDQGAPSALETEEIEEV